MLALGATRARIDFLNAKHQVIHRQTGNAASRVEARGEFIGKVHAYMDKYQVDYDRAYRTCQRQFANVYGASMTGTSNASAASRAATSDGRGSGSAPGLSGRLTGTTGHPTPLVNNGLRSLFYLPESASQEVFDAAYLANGKSLTPINAAKIFDGLATYYMDQKSLSHDAAIAYCKKNFPDLWEAVKTLAKPA